MNNHLSREAQIEQLIVRVRQDGPGNYPEDAPEWMQLHTFLEALERVGVLYSKSYAAERVETQWRLPNNVANLLIAMWFVTKE